MKKTLFVIPFLLVILIFIAYIFTYQQVVNEGSFLADEHCIKVNPLIISRKDSYLKQYNLMLTNTTSEEYLKALDNYMKLALTYQEQEKEWIAKNSKYLNSWAFKTLIPKSIQEGANYQQVMYEAEYNSSRYLSEAYTEKSQDKQYQLAKKVVEETAKSKEAGEKYDETWNKYSGQSNWIYFFVKVPQPKCPVENYDIPVLPDPFAPPLPVNEGETKS